MLCASCQGSGSHVAFTNGRPRWRDCEPCDATGATDRTGPATIAVKFEPGKYAKQLAKNQAAVAAHNAAIGG